MQFLQKKEVKVKITFWKNGFTVDDSTLRDYNDKNNEAFLNSVKQGIIPQELQIYGNDILVDINDSRGEDFKSPPPTLTPFSGSGLKLGSTNNNTTVLPKATFDTNEEIIVDKSLPVTSVQIRLQDGSRIIGSFNHTHQIKHIRSFINRTKPTNANYSLCTAFPQQIITDENQTIANAGLLNSVVIQKIS